jgi:hypothetical protein
MGPSLQVACGFGKKVPSSYFQEQETGSKVKQAIVSLDADSDQGKPKNRKRKYAKNSYCLFSR